MIFSGGMPMHKRKTGTLYAECRYFIHSNKFYVIGSDQMQR